MAPALKILCLEVFSECYPLTLHNKPGGLRLHPGAYKVSPDILWIRNSKQALGEGQRGAETSILNLL